MQDEAAFHDAVRTLTDADKALRRLVEDFGLPEFWHRPAGFPAMVLFVLEQQVSLSSAASSYERLRATAGDVSPEAILAAGTDAIRASGVTRQKTRYIQGIAEEVVGDRLDFGALDGQEDQAVRSRLVALTGIGPWTADVYLLSCLRRPDIWPVGDRALQVGTAEALGRGEVPSPSDLEEIGERWRPHRSTAARLLWHRYLTVRGR